MLEKVPKNDKPQDKASTKSQGAINNGNSKDNANGELKQSHSRYEKGMQLYRDGKVCVGSNGLFKVSGYYEADTEKMTCTCPDYKTRRETCKHLFAAMLFVKNRGKQKIEHLEGKGDWLTEMMNDPAYDKPKEDIIVNNVNNDQKPTEAHSKDFDKQAVITRLATINSAIEALKTHRKPIEFSDIVSLAVQLEKWALGGQP